MTVGVAVGLLLGAGLFCVWWSFWAPGPPRVRRADGWAARTQDLLVQAGAPAVTPGALVVASVGVGLVVLLVGTVLARSWTIATCFAVIAAGAPALLVRSARVGGVRDCGRSGPRCSTICPRACGPGCRCPRPWVSSASAVPSSCASRSPSSRATTAPPAGSGVPRPAQDRLADPVADRIVEALRITRDLGGTDLGRLLRTLSTFLREDVRTRGELEARQSWTVNGARLAVAGPWVVLGFLATRPETAAAYNSMTGGLVLAAGAACSAAAYQLMLRIGRLPEEERVLR